MAKKPILKADARGQLEINGIDTPLGEACNGFMEAELTVQAALATRDLAATNVMQEMTDANLRTCKFKGNVIRYQPGHKTPDKIKLIPGK